MTRREGWLWAAAVAYFGVILATLTVVQGLLLWLRERNLLRLSLLVLFAGVALVAGVVVVAGRPRRRETMTVLAIGACYALLLSRMEILQERLHIVQYGVLALLLLVALEERGRHRAAAVPGWRAPLLAGLFTAGAGLVDELVQGILPSRVGDWRDVAFNAFAGALALGALTLRRLARGRDAAAAARERRVDAVPH